MQIRRDVSLKPFNTFGIDVRAKYFTSVTDITGFQEVVREEVYRTREVLVLGGGSNILLTGDFDGLVVRNEIMGVDIIDESDEYATLKIGAGEIWHDLVEFSLNHQLGGLENLSLIPGTVGAAPIQNIGAYGVEIKTVFLELEAVDRSTGQLKIFREKDCEFAYRNSIFKNRLKDKYVVCNVTLKLSKKPTVNTSYGVIEEYLKKWNINDPGPRDVSRAVIAIRQSKLPDPRVIGNAGSFFKNPVISLNHYRKLKETWTGLPGYTDEDEQIKVPAAWLIEACGWKGKRFGDIGVHEMQALVLVNHGGGRGRDIHDLAIKIRQSVKDRFDIDMVPEVNIIPGTA